MRLLRYSINTTLDGCCSHEAGIAPDEDSMRFWAEQVAQADAVIFGRVTYQMMESAWRKPDSGSWPDWVQPWQRPFAEAMHAARKYVASSTLGSVDWNASLLSGDAVHAVRRLKEQPGGSLWVGGVTLPTALANHGLIDEFEFLVHPFLAGHGPTLLDGLGSHVRLELVGRREFDSGMVALRYRPVSGAG